MSPRSHPSHRLSPRPGATPGPRDPDVAALVRLARSASTGRISRRSLLAGAGGLGLASVLAACGTGGGTTPAGDGESSAQLTPAEDRSAEDGTLRWSNWTLYLDYDDAAGVYPTLERFQAESGLEVTYTEDIDSNDGFFGKYQNQLSRGQDIGADLITLTDWMAARLIRLGQVQELDAGNIPHLANLLPNYREVEWDPGRVHSATWQGGFTGLAWNKEEVPGGLRALDDLWDPALKGRVVVLDEMLDTMGLLMMADGVDITGDWGDTEFDNALEVLQKHIASGQIRQVKGNAYKEDLISGDALAVIGWSGDITQLNVENGDRWGFTLPEAGGTMWADNLMVPMGSSHKANAEKLIDFYYDPAVAAEVAAYVNFVCPVEGAREEMEKIDPQLAQDPMIFPTDEYLANAQIIRALTPEEETRYNESFQRAIGN
ncbi:MULTISPECIES: polyamine ABC transporter substrate-binding protein [Citricoccus]|uniref:polyamine ABC transporter substrate-binding protein n=1 Tax=Citricoccus TaxID=169133 RepID=UPI000255E167|nr:spermidine/putrescine ABC transporter substrate-binding protein [Citricoccus sp. CH26A]